MNFYLHCPVNRHHDTFSARVSAKINVVLYNDGEIINQNPDYESAVLTEEDDYYCMECDSKAQVITGDYKGQEDTEEH